MNAYLTVKLVHIISSTILFGTGIGIAFFMFRAYKSGDVAVMRGTNRQVVLADWLFTTPAIVVQFASGLWLTERLGIPYTSTWFIAVMSVFLFVGVCWLPVVWIQWRLNRMLSKGTVPGELPHEYHRLMRIWIVLGILAFTSVVVLFGLMVFKPGMN